ncbi:hypothetical protein, partial [Legionella pneumophila]
SSCTLQTLTNAACQMT